MKFHEPGPSDYPGRHLDADHRLGDNWPRHRARARSQNRRRRTSLRRRTTN